MLNSTTMASEIITTRLPLGFAIPEEVSSTVSKISAGTCFEQDGAQEESFLKEEDAQSAIGLSMSHVHSRLMSTKLPAAEKAALIAESDRGELIDGAADSQFQREDVTAQDECRTNSDIDEGVGRSTLSRRYSDESLQRIPSPWIAGPRVFESSKPPTHGRSASRGFISGPTNVLADLNVRRFVSTFNLPGLPKAPNLKDMSLPTISSVFGGRDGAQAQKPIMKQTRANTVLPLKSPWGCSTGASSGQSHVGRQPYEFIASSRENRSSVDQSLRSSIASKTVATPSSETDQGAVVTPAHQTAKYSQNRRPLRRASSDDSLLLRRVTSTVSSLGDDTRWEHVQQQVNSRMQAIKDSLQDSNIKLPSIPALPNINLNSLRPELFRPRGKSDPRSFAMNERANAAGNLQLGIADGVLDSRQPFDPKALEGPRAKKFATSLHPTLDKALENLTGDLVVMGGYRGSILRSAKPPHQQLWVPIKVGLNIRKVDLEVGLTSEDEETMHEKVIASGMLSHIGPIDMGRRLLKRLRSCKNAQEGRLRIHDYGYDWRLSPHLLSQRLVDFLKKLPCNAPGVPEHERGATVIAHSLGGLITRHAVNQQPILFAGVLYAGVPQHCINILGPLRNGDDVLLSSKVLTAQVNFTLRTSFLLLPEEGHCFISKTTKQEYPIDFFNPETWSIYALSPCIATTLPPFTALEEKKSLLSTVYNTLPSFPTTLKRSSNNLPTRPATASLLSQPITNPSIQCTIPRPLALTYLSRTLASVRTFKRELAHNTNHAVGNTYPPISVLYSTSTPTVYRAKVVCRDAIRHADAYDDLQFASGDGVCLARAAMAPKGYEVCEGGKVRVERGHLGLLGDGEGVGKCLLAIWEARNKGAGLGKSIVKLDSL